MEYEYSRCAMQCGIIMSETRLFHLRDVRDISVLKDLIEDWIKQGVKNSYADSSGTVGA